MEKLHVAAIELPPLPTNSYIIHNRTRAVVIDPGGIPDSVAGYLTDNHLTLTHILLTHLHSDHTVGAGPLSATFGAPVYASEKDAWMLDDYLGKGDDDWGIPPVQRFSFDHLSAGPLEVLDGVCMVLETPGHSPGGLSFYFESIAAVFPGDTLFRRTTGRTDFSGGDAERIAASLRDVLFRLPEDTRVFPGHGPSFLLNESLAFKQFFERRSG